MRALILILPLLLLLPAPASAGAGDEFVVDLELVVRDPNTAPLVNLNLVEDPPEGVAAIEEEGVRYIRRALGPERELLLAARFWPEPAWVRVDLDFDGELTALEQKDLTGTTTTLTAEIPIEFPLVAGGEPREVRLSFVHHHTANRTCFHLRLPLRRSGEAVLAGRQREMALGDANGDLAFDPATDKLRLDLDGNMKLDPGEEVASGEAFHVAGRGFVAEVSAAGRITFRELEVVPPPPAPAWRKTGVPRAGVKWNGEVKPLAELREEWKKAEREDEEAGPNSYTHRRDVTTEIGHVGTEAAFRWLLGIADAPANINLQSAAVRATGYEVYAPFAAELVAIAKSGAQTSVRMAALTALHAMNAPGRAAVYLEFLDEQADESVFQTAARHLGYLATVEGRARLAQVALNHSNERFRYHAYQAATRYFGEPPTKGLVLAAARSPEPRLRALGLADAALLRLPEARDLALASLVMEDEPVRIEAVRILALAGDEESVGALLALAAPTPKVRAVMVSLLRPVRDDGTVDFLIGHLEARRPDARALAADVLAGIDLERVTRALTARVGKEKDGTVLAALARALGAHGSDEAAAALVGAAENARRDPEALAAALDALAKLGFERIDVQRFFRKLSNSRQAVERMLAAEAAALSGSNAAVAFLLDALVDEDWRVRLEGAKGLARIRVKRAVPVLIDLLEKEENPRVRSTIAETLFFITGEHYYDLPELWRKWWEESGEEFEVPEKLPERVPDDDHGGQSVASFYGVPVDSDRIIFVIDQSGSMSGMTGNVTKLERAIEETVGVVTKLPKAARLNVIFFETNIHPWQKRLVKVSSSRAAVVKHLRSQRPTGGTNLYDGLEMALLTEGVDTIYLLSDGSPGSGKWVAHEDILRETKKLNRTRKVAIHCIAVGFDSPLMKEIAAQNDGQYARR